MAKGRSARSRTMAHCCLSSGTERTAVPRLARQPADADATASSTSSQGPKGAITNGTSMPSRSHSGVRSLVDTANSFQPAVHTGPLPASGIVPGGGRRDARGLGFSRSPDRLRRLVHLRSLTLRTPAICFFCDRALSDRERQGARGSLPDLLMDTLDPPRAGSGGSARGAGPLDRHPVSVPAVGVVVPDRLVLDTAVVPERYCARLPP